jgi:glycosidase
MGTLEDIRELVTRAHKKEMRMILDFVANHWSDGHPTFQEAKTDRNSPFYDWYFWKKWPHQYETYYNVAELPKINVDHPGAREYLLRSVQFWLGEVGFDGLRLDYAPGPTHDFWIALRDAALDVKPDVWIFGEVVASPDQQMSYSGRFHGCLDFLLTQKLRETFGFGTLGLAAFNRFLRQHEAYFPGNFSRPSFLDNHDMDRFLWISKGDLRKLKLAALCLFTLKGPPIIYYGTEVGMSQERSNGDPQGNGMAECRQPMRWGADQDREIASYFKKLIEFRRAHPVIWGGVRKTVHLDEARGTYAYVCHDDNEKVLVAFNLGGEECILNVEDSELALDHTFVLPALSGRYVII